VIDLHLHTTASDGRCTPEELVDRAAAARLSVMAVTDHDTTAATLEVREAARARGLEAVSGIEITAVEEGRDVHILGYFLDPIDGALNTFLVAQRASRIARVEAIGARLAALGVPIETGALIARARRAPGRSIGRPQIARAMIEAGHVADTRDAFDRWLGLGCPGFVPRDGAAPEAVIDVIHQAGGVASLAHPGKTAIDARIASLRSGGLDALEAFHPDHDAGLVQRYLAMARELELLVTGGSDFHADPARALEPGSVTLPDAEWERVRARASHGSR
jgi:hypothetical protein